MKTDASVAQSSGTRHARLGKCLICQLVSQGLRCHTLYNSLIDDRIAGLQRRSTQPVTAGLAFAQERAERRCRRAFTNPY
jgi:hypothetical protein